MRHEERVRRAGRALPEIVRAARMVHRTESEIRTAVLLAWTGLAGVLGWTPGMVKRVERVLRVVAVMVAIAGAGRAATIVAETAVKSPSGKLATGTITITAVVPFRAASGAWVETVGAAIAVVNGRFSVALEPNIAQTSYKAHWQLDGAAARDEFWIVTGAGPLTLSNVIAARIAPGIRVLLSQLDVTGAVEGACIKLTGGVWIPSTNCGGSTGTWGNISGTWGNVSGTWGGN